MIQPQPRKMPALSGETVTPKKRKRSDDLAPQISSKGQATADSDINYEADILAMETGILESRKNLNDIPKLIAMLSDGRDAGLEKCIFAAISLCRVFCKHMAAGNFSKSKNSSENDQTIAQWLTERLQEFNQRMEKWLASRLPLKSSTAMTLLLRIFRERSKYLDESARDSWSSGIFAGLMSTLLTAPSMDFACGEYVEKFVNKYDDVRYHTFSWLADKLAGEMTENEMQNALALLTRIRPMSDEDEDFPVCFLNTPTKSKKQSHLHSRPAHKKQAHRAWLGLLRQNLDKAQRKQVLEVMSSHIAPWFLKVELLMDFMADSFNIGGSTSLMALSGLFYLIQNKNLDYPQFYQKLYSLLDEDILHSKHRSRFFRLLDTFLSSTHLPAALVASFIKRLSRLSLHAPPSGIVVVVPWIYNLLKSHPTCTFMIHRKNTLVEKDEEGWGDPFCMEEPDPMETDAIESSLWELQTLQSHYHPNVATIAKIISEQFTKHSYNTEDFLDHSYATMLDAELAKDVKKAPEIEYEIPKKIFTKYEANTGKEDSMLVKLWGFS